MITKDKTIAEILEENPKSAQVFGEFGFGCLGCAGASGETLEEAAARHGIDLEILLKKLNEAE